MLFLRLVIMVTLYTRKFKVKFHAVTYIFQNHTSALIYHILSINRCITCTVFHTFLYRLQFYFFLNLITANIDKCYRIKNDNLINYIPNCRFPIHRLYQSLKSSRCRNVITHTFNFHFRAVKRGIIAFNHNFKSVTHFNLLIQNNLHHFPTSNPRPTYNNLYLQVCKHHNQAVL